MSQIQGSSQRPTLPQLVPLQKRARCRNLLTIRTSDHAMDYTINMLARRRSMVKRRSRERGSGDHGAGGGAGREDVGGVGGPGQGSGSGSVSGSGSKISTPSKSLPQQPRRRFFPAIQRRRTNLFALRTIISKVHREEEQARKVGAKFRRLAKFLVVLFSLWKVHAKKVASFLETNVDLMDVDEPVDLLFDVSHYKAAKQVCVSEETIRILQKRPSLRTEEEVKYVQIALGNYPTIAVYPPSMKRLMAEKSWYEIYERKRIILQEGHVPRCYYFILAGSVVVSRRGMSKISSTVCMLQRGENFGELGLINNVPRRATVISKEKVQLLVFSDEAYIEIFLSGGLKSPHDPFFKSIPFLKGWPLERLTENPSDAFLSYFKKGTVLVKDSRYSQWIYIVKSGSCTVLKKLRRVRPTQPPPVIPYKPPKIDLPESVHRRLLDTRLERENSKLNRLQLLVRSRMIQELDLHVSIHPIQIPAPASASSEDTPHEQDNPEASDHPAPVDPQPQGARVKSRKKKVTIAEHRNKHHDVDEQTPGDQDNSQQASQPDSETGAQTTSQNQESSHGSLAEKLTRAKAELKKKLEQRNRKLHQEKVSIVEDLNDGYDLRSDESPTEADLHPQFVRVQTLSAGSVFGLSDLVHEDQPSLSLVSNGSECVMMKKSLFLDHAPSHLIRELRTAVSPYPNDQTLQESLQCFVDWNHHKATLVMELFRHATIHGLPSEAKK